MHFGVQCVYAVKVAVKVGAFLCIVCLVLGVEGCGGWPLFVGGA